LSAYKTFQYNSQLFNNKHTADNSGFRVGDWTRIGQKRDAAAITQKVI